MNFVDNFFVVYKIQDKSTNFHQIMINKRIVISILLEDAIKIQNLTTVITSNVYTNTSYPQDSCGLLIFFWFQQKKPGKNHTHNKAAKVCKAVDTCLQEAN